MEIRSRTCMKCEYVKELDDFPVTKTGYWSKVCKECTSQKKIDASVKPTQYRCPHCREIQTLPFNPIERKHTLNKRDTVRIGLERLKEYICINCNKKR